MDCGVSGAESGMRSDTWSTDAITGHKVNENGAVQTVGKVRFRSHAHSTSEYSRQHAYSTTWKSPISIIPGTVNSYISVFSGANDPLSYRACGV